MNCYNYYIQGPATTDEAQKAEIDMVGQRFMQMYSFNYGEMSLVKYTCGTILYIHPVLIIIGNQLLSQLTVHCMVDRRVQLIGIPSLDLKIYLMQFTAWLILF